MLLCLVEKTLRLFPLSCGSAVQIASRLFKAWLALSLFLRRIITYFQIRGVQLLSGANIADEARDCFIQLCALMVSKQSQTYLMAALIVPCSISGKADSKRTNSSVAGP